MRERPRTKAGQVRQAWPEIKALLDSGHSLKDIWMWLNEIGIAIGYARLSDYLGRLKRREQAALAGTVQPVPEVVRVAEHPLPSENTLRETRTETARTIATN